MAIVENYLFDTNLFLEVFLNQENTELSKKLINHKNLTKIFISDFSLHSIGVILSRKSKSQAFQLFIEDIVQSNKFEIITIKLKNMKLITENIIKFSLDFDDAYQLTVSDLYNLKIVTYDNDFNKREISSTSPNHLYEKLESTSSF